MGGRRRGTCAAIRASHARGQRAGQHSVRTQRGPAAHAGPKLEPPVVEELVRGLPQPQRPAGHRLELRHLALRGGDACRRGCGHGWAGTGKQAKTGAAGRPSPAQHSMPRRRPHAPRSRSSWPPPPPPARCRAAPRGSGAGARPAAGAAPPRAPRAAPRAPRSRTCRGRGGAAGGRERWAANGGLLPGASSVHRAAGSSSRSTAEAVCSSMHQEKVPHHSLSRFQVGSCSSQ